MVEREVTVINRLGLHARAAAKLVQLLGQYRSKATLICRGREVNGKSIMGVMLLAAGKDTQLTVRLDGQDEAEALEAVCALFARYFDEGG
ncbi:HPr family phosphocarrier protein [Pseudomarimonas salicorniae]|uniref:HPr family phosphocarrier protein n=1 Tax=Pseudomarimonas salicorniae TaxID=2933270 RepID=A0ABT0GH60_9GAMM|nr:HPr family phosphocarrier protein [Lysobacter sp. CAU 1642]MCK7593866.1 HPr family phosphocarrier protein [Lysobacter sp. CAU 1642]